MYFANRFRDALKDGGCALFLGIAAEQVPEEFRTNPRLLFMGEDEARLRNPKHFELPVRTRVVIATRFLRHATAIKVQEKCKKTGALWMGKLSGTGEIAKMLHEAIPPESQTPVADTIDLNTAIVAEPPPPPPPPEDHHTPLFPTPEPGMVFRSVTDCVRFYAKRE